MASIFLYRRGKGVKRRVAHLAKFDARGNIVSAWCGSTIANTSCNLSLGLRVCKVCRRNEGATP